MAAASFPAAKAVSEYELLKNMKSRFEAYKDRDDDDDDNIPLKPLNSTKGRSTSFFKSSVLNTFDSGNTNTNNINTNNAYSTLRSDLFASQRTDDSHLEPANSIPIPVDWSPIKSNPSLWLTPDKDHTKKPVSKKGCVPDNVLEPQDINKIPLPSAWSPGMLVRPDPSLFITPEKQHAKNIPLIKDNYATLSSESKENHMTLLPNTETAGIREKHTVRFDLPSLSSGDETMNKSQMEDSFDESASPITLRGTDDFGDTASPQWKPFSPPKVYNPGAYSDESALEDSIVNLHSQVSSNLFPPPSSNLNSVSSSSLIKTTSSSSSDLKPEKKRKVKKIKQNTEAEVLAREGPQFIKGQQSQYDADRPKPSIVRESKNKFVSEDYSFPFESGAFVGGSENEHVFARPEYNSTLKVRAELDTLCQQEVDVEKALHDTLAKSELKRTEINEKASVYTNRASDQFGNLVNLEPSVEALCDRIVRMRTSQAPKKKKRPHKKKSSEADRAPDLQEFFTPDLQHDTANLSLPGITPVTVKLMTASDDVAFDLYRHNRVWNGIRDF